MFPRAPLVESLVLCWRYCLTRVKMIVTCVFPLKPIVPWFVRERANSNHSKALLNLSYSNDAHNPYLSPNCSESHLFTMFVGLSRSVSSGKYEEKEIIPSAFNVHKLLTSVYSFPRNPVPAGPRSSPAVRQGRNRGQPCRRIAQTEKGTKNGCPSWPHARCVVRPFGPISSTPLSSSSQSGQRGYGILIVTQLIR